MGTMKILLVDDEPSVLSFLKLLFDDAGYETVCAAGGKAGLREMLDSHPDAAIVDLLMPDMDGIELCARIREISSIPIVILTAVGKIGDRVTAFQAGADDYVTKPVGGRELIARVEARIRRSKWYSAADSSLNTFTSPSDQTKHPLSLESLFNTMWGPVYHPLEIVKWIPSDLRN